MVDVGKLREGLAELRAKLDTMTPADQEAEYANRMRCLMFEFVEVANEAASAGIEVELEFYQRVFERLQGKRFGEQRKVYDANLKVRKIL